MLPSPRARFAALAVPLLALSCAGGPSVPAGGMSAMESPALGGFPLEAVASRELAAGVSWTALEARRPRRLVLHVVRIAPDAVSKAAPLRAAALVGTDPDGAGPAEAVLLDPLAAALESEALVLVNANGFSFLGPDGPMEPFFPYAKGRPVDVYGAAVRDGLTRSFAAAGAPSLLVDDAGSFSIGPVPGPGVGVHQAVSGFGALISGGRVVPGPGGERHPRTAAGIDREGLLFLVVVDGRSLVRGPGPTLEELARILLDLGCVDALNLDGGGSSVLVIRGEDGIPRIVNEPSDRGFPRYALRPVPVMFAIVPAP